MGGNEDLVELLLQLGANATPTGDLATSPLIAASRMSRGSHFVRLLASYSADIHVRHGELETTALHVAAQRGHLEVVEALLELGADRGMRAAGGVHPYDLARSKAVR